ncbi:MAG: hypothetical protein ACFE8M_04425 [Candidatus Hermodarchaeota archaeon]
MNYQKSNSTEKGEILINKAFIYIFITCLVLSHILHELGHYFATIIQGGEFIMYFQSWEVITLLNENDTSLLIISFAGPIITIILAYFGIFLAEKTEKYRSFGISFAFSNSMMKMLDYIPNMLHIYKGGDEYWIAQMLGINEMVLYFIFFLVLLPPLIYILLKIYRDYSQRIKNLLIITFLLFLYVGLALLLDRLILFNQDILIFRIVFGLSLPFLIIGITSIVIFFTLLYHNIKNVNL